jgi:hypothetical protein
MGNLPEGGAPSLYAKWDMPSNSIQYFSPLISRDGKVSSKEARRTAVATLDTQKGHVSSIRACPDQSLFVY